MNSNSFDKNLDELRSFAELFQKFYEKNEKNFDEKLRQEENFRADVKKFCDEAKAENCALRKLVEERDEEIRQLKEKFETIERENPQFVEERLVQSMNKLKNDFRIMFERQAKFFLEKIETLKDEQRKNLSSLF